MDEARAQPFRKMADAIDHNKGSTFGGAAVIIPPGDGEIIEVLLLDSQGDVAQFLATVGQRLKNIAQKLDDDARRLGGFGR